jgi:hypothetical protein
LPSVLLLAPHRSRSLCTGKHLLRSRPWLRWRRRQWLLGLPRRCRCGSSGSSSCCCCRGSAASRNAKHMVNGCHACRGLAATLMPASGSSCRGAPTHLQRCELVCRGEACGRSGGEGTSQASVPAALERSSK